MQIFIITFSPSSGWISKTLDTEPSDTIESLKDRILSDNFTTDASKSFRFDGATLLGCKTLAEYSVVHGSTLLYVRWPALVFSAEKEQVDRIDEPVKEPEQPAQLCVDPPVESCSAKVRDKDYKCSYESPEKSIELLVAVAEEIETAVGSLWDRLVAFKKQADKDEKELAKRLSQGKRVKCPKAAMHVHYLKSEMEARAFLSKYQKFFVVVLSESMESITRICAAVAASVHLPCAVVSSAQVSNILSANDMIHGHFFANGSNIQEFRSEFLDEKKLIAFLNKCLGLK